MHKEESISFIKCMGRQYDLLTRIMERINFCYSLQVNWLFEFWFFFFWGGAWWRRTFIQCHFSMNQVMVNIGAGFWFSILTFYSMYQYFRWESEFYGPEAYFHISYTIFYSIYAIAVIQTGSLIACDVSIYHTKTIIQTNTLQFFSPIG